LVGVGSIVVWKNVRKIPFIKYRHTSLSAQELQVTAGFHQLKKISASPVRMSAANREGFAALQAFGVL
jgi:hypothetical protein